MLQGDAVGRVVFTGRPPNHERVLGTGDALCDGTVSAFVFHRYGLNDAGEMALAVTLADQRKLVVRVEPTDLLNDRCVTQVPEANAWFAALAALTALSLCRRARAGRSSGGRIGCAAAASAMAAALRGAVRGARAT